MMPSSVVHRRYGTVTLDDLGGGGQIQLTVDVQGSAGKFRDLMLNFDGQGITSISSGDGHATLVPDGYVLHPYSDGHFDIGGSDRQNWNSGSAFYTTLLTGSGPLTLDMFKVTDSSGNLNVALHLQGLTLNGDSSKVGGIWEEVGGRYPQAVQETVPETRDCRAARRWADRARLGRAAPQVCRDNRWFRDCDEENMTDQQVLLIGFATAALGVLVLYLVRRRRRLVIR